MVPGEEQIQRSQAAWHPLRQCAAHHGVVVAHVLENDANIADGTPLDGNARVAVMPALLNDALHGGIGPAIVGLAGVATTRCDGGEDDKPSELLTTSGGFVQVQCAEILGLCRVFDVLKKN